LRTRLCVEAGRLLERAESLDSLNLSGSDESEAAQATTSQTTTPRKQRQLQQQQQMRPEEDAWLIPDSIFFPGDTIPSGSSPRDAIPADASPPVAILSSSSPRDDIVSSASPASVIVSNFSPGNAIVTNVSPGGAIVPRGDLQVLDLDFDPARDAWLIPESVVIDADGTTFQQQVRQLLTRREKMMMRRALSQFRETGYAIDEPLFCWPGCMVYPQFRHIAG